MGELKITIKIQTISQNKEFQLLNILFIVFNCIFHVSKINVSNDNLNKIDTN